MIVAAAFLKIPYTLLISEYSVHSRPVHVLNFMTPFVDSWYRMFRIADDIEHDAATVSSFNILSRMSKQKHKHFKKEIKVFDDPCSFNHKLDKELTGSLTKLETMIHVACCMPTLPTRAPSLLVITFCNPSAFHAVNRLCWVMITPKHRRKW